MWKDFALEFLFLIFAKKTRGIDFPLVCSELTYACMYVCMYFYYYNTTGSCTTFITLLLLLINNSVQKYSRLFVRRLKPSLLR